MVENLGQTRVDCWFVYVFEKLFDFIVIDFRGFLFEAMYIEKLKEEELQSGEEGNSGVIVSNLESQSIVRSDVKRIVVGVGARVLFYPTLLYNVFRNKLQTEFRWWDKVDEVYVLDLVSSF